MPHVPIRELVLVCMVNRGLGSFYEGAQDRIAHRAAQFLHDQKAMIDELERAMFDETVPLFRPRQFDYFLRSRLPSRLAFLKGKS